MNNFTVPSNTLNLSSDKYSDFSAEEALKGELNKHKKAAPVLSPEVFSGESETPVLPLQQGPVKTLADFDAFRITKEKEVPLTPPSITIGDSPVAAPGNITPITAEGKAGKTALTSVIVAGSISKTGEVDGFTGLEVKPNPEGKAVIVMDTEQSAADQQYNMIKCMQRAGIDTTPDYYHAYNIRTLPLSDYQQFTNDVCELAAQAFNGIHMIVIDGGADYITSVNNEEEANAIVAYFIALAVKYNCPVILVIHLNENAGRNGDTMPRGHVGRQAIRKGYCQLNITKEGDISTLQALRARKASGSDTPLVCYKYDKEKGYHVSIDAEAIEAAKQERKDSVVYDRMQRIANEVFKPPVALRHKDAVEQIMKHTKKGQSTAKTYLGNMEGWDMITKMDDYYRLKV